jgi:cysteinyl-tRNA synthetase
VTARLLTGTDAERRARAFREEDAQRTIRPGVIQGLVQRPRRRPGDLHLADQLQGAECARLRQLAEVHPEVVVDGGVGRRPLQGGTAGRDPLLRHRGLGRPFRQGFGTVEAGPRKLDHDGHVLPLFTERLSSGLVGGRSATHLGRREGGLSGRKIDELMTNTRDTEGMEEKRSPLDFAIWKKADPIHLMKWPSPWGEGFPGWHLECSAMSTKYLGQTFDIHGGGMDLKFPHHECEIAQSVAADGIAPVRYWMHGNMLTVNGRKMAKSEGNGFTPEELLTGNHKLLEKGYSAMTVRFFMLQCHYASTLDFSNSAMQAAGKGLERLMAALATIEKLKPSGSDDAGTAALTQRCYAAMNDDLNTPVMIAELFEGVRMINSAKDGKLAISAEGIEGLRSLFQDMVFNVLGLKREETAQADDTALDGLVQEFIRMRAEAKARKDFAASDKVRDQLAALGITLKDTKEGTTWERA